MPAQTYEALFILDSNVYAREAAVLSGSLQQVVERHGGEVLTSRLWEERRLAYPIGSHKKGVYWLTYFKAAGPQVPLMRREFEINESILRNMIVRLEPSLADEMVAHAKGGVIVQPVTIAVVADEAVEEGPGDLDI